MRPETEATCHILESAKPPAELRVFSRRLLNGLSIVLLALSASCDGLGPDRYDVHSESNGRVVRLDKKTGEMKILVGDHLRDVSEKPDSDETKAVATKPGVTGPALHTWPELANSPEKGVTLRLKTKLRGMRLFYEFVVVEPRGVGSSQRRYVPVLRDADNLELFLIPMPEVGSFEYGETDDHGRLTAVTHYGTIECSPELYDAATSWWVRMQ